jgi:outer membrane protein TolC
MLITLSATPRVCGAAEQRDRPVLTLGQAVSEALQRNDRMINEHDTVEQAALGVRLAENNFRPKVVPNIQGSFGQSDARNQNYRLDVLQRFTTGSEARASFGTSTALIPSVTGLPGQDINFYNADTAITFSQPLLRGFGPSVARRSLTSAEGRRIDATLERTIVEQAVAVDTAAAYYRIVAQQALVAVATTTLERSRRLRASAEAKLDAGLVSQLDVFRAEQLVSQAEIQLFDAESAVEDARDQLCFLIGRSSDEAFDVVGDIPKAVDLVSTDEAARIAVDNRLDLRRSTLAVDEAERAIAYTRNQLLPQFDVNFSLTRSQTADSFRSSFGTDGFKFATFLAVSMPLDRTPMLVDHYNAAIERDRRRREGETLRKRVVDEVKRAVRQRDRAVRNLAAAEASVAIGKKEVEVAQLRYERGLSNNLDVVTAEAGLLSIESRRVSTAADLAVVQLALRAAMGILDPQKDLVGNPTP